MTRSRISHQDSASLGGWLFADLFVLLMVIGLAGFTIVRDEPGGPRVRTAPASDITSDSAKLNAQVDTGDAETRVTFRWGRTRTLEDGVADAKGSPFDAGVVDLQVGGMIVGLEPKTTYFFQAIAESNRGTAEGVIRSFQTRHDGTCTDGPKFVSKPFPGEYTYESARNSLARDIGNWIEGRNFVTPKIAVALVTGWTTNPAGSEGASRAANFFSQVISKVGRAYVDEGKTAFRPLQGQKLRAEHFKVELFFVDTAKSC